MKAHIALHQVYGVDLNATAVELAEISLWLDTMVAGLQAPWFGLHLRRGNSLIGARRAVYAPTLLAKKAWLTTAPERRPAGRRGRRGHPPLPAAVPRLGRGDRHRRGQDVCTGEARGTAAVAQRHSRQPERGDQEAPGRAGASGWRRCGD